MNTPMHDHSQNQPPSTQTTDRPSRQNFELRPSGFWRSKAGFVAGCFLLIAALLLVSEHRAHALGYLPFLLLFACLFLHMFMHGGHGGRGDHAGHSEDGARSEPSNPPPEGV